MADFANLVTWLHGITKDERKNRQAREIVVVIAVVAGLLFSGIHFTRKESFDYFIMLVCSKAGVPVLLWSVAVCCICSLKEEEVSVRVESFFATKDLHPPDITSKNKDQLATHEEKVQDLIIEILKERLKEKVDYPKIDSR